MVNVPAAMVGGDQVLLRDFILDGAFNFMHLMTQPAYVSPMPTTAWQEYCQFKSRR
jgi:hypothetical protein